MRFRIEGSMQALMFDASSLLEVAGLLLHGHGRTGKVATKNKNSRNPPPEDEI